MPHRIVVISIAALLSTVACSNPEATPDEAASSPEYFASDPEVADEDVVARCELSEYPNSIREVECPGFVISTFTERDDRVSESEMWYTVSSGLRDRFPGRFGAMTRTIEIDGQARNARHFFFDDDQGETGHDGLFFIDDEERERLSFLCFNPHGTVELPRCRRAIEQVAVDGFSGVGSDDAAPIGPSLGGEPVEYDEDVCQVFSSQDRISCSVGHENHQMSWAEGPAEQTQRAYDEALERIRQTPRVTGGEVREGEVDCEVLGRPAKRCQRVVSESSDLKIVGYVALTSQDHQGIMLLCTFQDAPSHQLPPLCERVLSVD